MRFLINNKITGEVLGRVLTNHTMSDDMIFEAAGIELAITQEDYESMPENGKYDLDELEIIEA